MLDEAAARALVAARLSTDPRLVLLSCEPSRDGTRFLLEVNTEAYARTGEVALALVGTPTYAVDRVTGEVEAFRDSWCAEQILEDRRDAAEAAARTWVVRPLAEAGAVGIVRVRQWLGCTPERARALVRAGPWFRGTRREMHHALAYLVPLGVPVEVALVEDPGAALDVWVGSAEHLKAVLTR